MAAVKNWVMEMEIATEDAVYSGAKTMGDVLNYVKGEMNGVVDEKYVTEYAECLFAMMADFNVRENAFIEA